MKRLFLAAAALVAALSGVARAQTAPMPAYSGKVFATVDAVSIESSNRVVVTGIVQGETAPTTWYVSKDSDTFGFAENCQRVALLAMAKPGQYLLEIKQPSYNTPVCKLTRVVP
jgi:hypothetical protein